MIIFGNLKKGRSHKCPASGLNPGPSDEKSDALLTALSRCSETCLFVYELRLSHSPLPKLLLFSVPRSGFADQGARGL